MRGIKAAAALMLVLPLCGCVGGDRGREPENTVLAQVVGVDRMGEVWTLTAAGKDSAGEIVLRTAAGDTLAGAFAALPGAGESWMSVTGVSDFLLGEGAPPEEVLLYILDESGMSWRANVWYVPLAAPVMKECDGGGDRLTVLKESGTGTVSVLDALAALRDEGETALPALTVKNGKLTASGTIYYERRERDGG